ncbi:hypothetical protein [Fodinicola acaciae]|uniref:hypothetical protein n=1 Tax=Fodinicola acaciae TaxID=2681555 RepID=UPI0013D004A1|nr:hypothetical protein [Fodinicola acaciae]
MHARVQVSRDATVGDYLFEQIGDGRRMTVSLLAAADGDVFEVRQDIHGSASPARVMSAGYFDGPLSPVRIAAEDEAAAQAAAVVATFPGFVRTLRLWQPVSRGLVVLTMCRSIDGLEALRRAVDALPDRDPVLLPGPDRSEIYRVVTLART